MLIYGKKSKPFSATLLNVKCTKCGASEVSLVRSREYAHLFWIPVFPMKKIIFTSCGHCKQVLSEKEFPVSYLNEIVPEEVIERPPIWMWSGLFLLAMIFVFGSYLADQDKEENSKLLENPMSGMVFGWSMREGFYTYSRIVKVTDDTVFVQWNDIRTKSIREFIRSNSNYLHFFNDSISSFSKSDLIRLFQDGEIEDVYP